MARDERLRVSSIGEHCKDLLRISSATSGRTDSQQAAILLSLKLEEMEDSIKSRVNYLATKRGISFEGMWLRLLKGDYAEMTDQELEDLEEISSLK